MGIKIPAIIAICIAIAIGVIYGAGISEQEIEDDTSIVNENAIEDDSEISTSDDEGRQVTIELSDSVTTTGP